VSERQLGRGWQAAVPVCEDVSRLPDAEGLIVAYDTEASGLSTGNGARICSISIAWRARRTGHVEAIAVPFDMGFDHSSWLGPKQLPADHAGRLEALIATHGRDCWDVVNQGERQWLFVMDWLSHQRLVMHNGPFDCLMTHCGLRGHPELGRDLEPRLYWDSQGAQGILEPDEERGLKPTSVRHHVGRELGFPEGMESAEQEALAPWKGPQQDPRYDLIPWRVLAPYGIVDAQLALLVAEWQWRQLDAAPDSAELYERVNADLGLKRLMYRVERHYRFAAEPRRSESPARPGARPDPAGAARTGEAASTGRGQTRAGRRGSARVTGTHPRPSQQTRTG
jgi:hypothetical protein